MYTAGLSPKLNRNERGVLSRCGRQHHPAPARKYSMCVVGERVAASGKIGSCQQMLWPKKKNAPYTYTSASWWKYEGSTKVSRVPAVSVCLSLFASRSLAIATRFARSMRAQGTIYLRGYGLEERSAVSRLHDPASRIVSVVKCSTMHGDERLPENRDYCDRSKRRYDTYDYADMMNTTFALVPSGRSPGTFRLGEVSNPFFILFLVLLLLLFCFFFRFSLSCVCRFCRHTYVVCMLWSDAVHAEKNVVSIYIRPVVLCVCFFARELN